MRGGVPHRSGVTLEAQDTSPSALTSMRISSSSSISASVGVAMGSDVTSGCGRATSNVVTAGTSTGMASAPSNGTNDTSSANCCCSWCGSATSSVALGASNAGNDCPKEEIGVVCQYSIAKGSMTDDPERQLSSSSSFEESSRRRLLCNTERGISSLSISACVAVTFALPPSALSALML